MDENENADFFVSGSWNSGKNNAISLWEVFNKETSPELNELGRVNMEADVNDIF